MNVTEFALDCVQTLAIETVKAAGLLVAFALALLLSVMMTGYVDPPPDVEASTPSAYHAPEVRKAERNEILRI
jgi:hypothetical protein